jgi:maltose alpha-D-glucosyltransferase/alpha-amylase
MAYHFPLMPRMYMAIAQEDRHPIVEIIDQTPDIPGNCQWAIFLRNHDELDAGDGRRAASATTCTRCTPPDSARQVEPRHPPALAPLMDNDLDRIKLMNSLLLSMPGSPIHLLRRRDRHGRQLLPRRPHGVRTPMQWSPERNAGLFARRSAAAVSAADHGSDVRLRGRERRGADARSLVAAQMDEAMLRRASSRRHSGAGR